ncbi:AAA family ATPase [Methylobacterium sp. Leaf456]|uniref:AAA family ATPase n=1 Tax=Methylobacterium sp. Leaf456 TaxID=1736382 RepID=UPI000A61A39F|nr:AAA family ATPase [Methylobacterium sp. Leaf456]
MPPFAGLPDLPALRELQGHPHWVAWEYVWKPERGKWDKPPVNPATGYAAQSNNPATWAPYSRAAEFAAKRGMAGVGFVLDGQGEHSGIDLDGCRDPDTGRLQAWAQVAVDFGETYAEVSPSGRGLRFFVKGKIDGRKIDAAQVELYASGRYLTVTGQHLPGTPIEIREAPRTIAYLQERADQFREAQRAAAEMARTAERGKAERRGDTGSAEKPRRERPAGERSFWEAVKDRALANLPAWVPSLFPTAQRTSDGGYRVSSHDLMRDLQEDLSLHPEGIKDFGIHDMGDPNDGGRTAIDIVEEYLPARTPAEAAFWLCRQLGVRPEDLGWRGEQPGPQASQEEQKAAAASLRAIPFGWCDASAIPVRQWVYGRHYVRKFVSVTVAPGGVGKSSLAIVEALAMTSGQGLLGELPSSVSKVWYWNGEDPMEELQRRVMATALHHQLAREDIEGHLFVNSGRDTEMVLAEQTRAGITIAVPVVEAVKATIRENGIDVVIIDPFVSSHRVSENDNGAIDRVAKLWARIADETGCAVELIHHARKTNGAEVTMEDGRGAVALLAAARSGRILNVMSPEEAKQAGVEQRRLHFRVDNGKANLAPPPEGTSWLKLASVTLGNGFLGTDGDSVGVVTRWKWPDPLDDVSVSDLRAAQQAVSNGRWRENIQARDWVGKAIASALQLNLDDSAHKEKVKRLLQVWTASGMFVVTTGLDANRIERAFVEVGEWASA